LTRKPEARRKQKAIILADRPYRRANDGTPIYGYQPSEAQLDEITEEVENRLVRKIKQHMGVMR
jgi:hypothetical protein